MVCTLKFQCHRDTFIARSRHLPVVAYIRSGKACSQVASVYVGKVSLDVRKVSLADGTLNTTLAMAYSISIPVTAYSIDAGNGACGHAGIDEVIDAACTRGDGVRGRQSKEIDAALACTAVAHAAVDQGIDTVLAHARRWRVRRR